MAQCPPPYASGPGLKTLSQRPPDPKNKKVRQSAIMNNMWSNNRSRMLGCVAIGNPEQHVRKASHRGSKQQ